MLLECISTVSDCRLSRAQIITSDLPRQSRSEILPIVTTSEARTRKRQSFIANSSLSFSIPESLLFTCPNFIAHTHCVCVFVGFNSSEKDENGRFLRHLLRSSATARPCFPFACTHHRRPSSVAVFTREPSPPSTITPLPFFPIFSVARVQTPPST
ncbi:hypothetical protein L2E82_09035 [Cichorium intybus]|uniref:Uncharacterized protein n=1 Tax=Cichorium intybus TaxID=13427 RepID=A0ACB9G8D7_CICIN|nr:hypothetical protein L2E82_09035 [Cichorium intybus]